MSSAIIVNDTILYSKIITFDEEKFWKINDCKKILKNIQIPDQCFLKEPTPWNLYKKFHWKEIYSNIKSINSTLVSNSNFLLQKHFCTYTNFNNKSENYELFIPNIFKEFNTSIKIFYNTTKIPEKKINYIIHLNNITLNFNHTFGKQNDYFFLNNFDLNLTSVNIELLPKCKAELYVYSIFNMYLYDIKYNYFLNGNIALNYKNRYDGHYFWAGKIEDFIKSNYLINEKIHINYYDNIKFVAKKCCKKVCETFTESLLKI